MINFKTITREELTSLEKERAIQLSNSLFVEAESFSPVINDLRFNHGFLHVMQFLIHHKTGCKYELIPADVYKNVHLAFIGVPEGKRQQGFGSELMTILTNVCDKYGYNITLEIEPKFGVNKKTLKKFYQKFGFVKDEDGMVKDSMIRYAKKESVV